MLIRKLPISTPSSSSSFSSSSSSSSFLLSQSRQQLYSLTRVTEIFFTIRDPFNMELCHVEYSIGFRVTRALYPLFVHAFYDDDSLSNPSNTRETTNPIIIVLWSFSIDVILFPFFLSPFFFLPFSFLFFSRNISIFLFFLIVFPFQFVYFLFFNTLFSV